MNLGDRIGLFWRTVLAPVTKTAFLSRDSARYDATGKLRTIMYSCPADVSREELNRIIRAATGKDHETARLIALAFLVFAGICVLFTLPGMMNMPRGLLISLAIVQGSFVLAAVLRVASRRIPTTANPDRVRDAWLKFGRCAACGYQLSEEAAAENTTPRWRCTECGALWDEPS